MIVIAHPEDLEAAAAVTPPDHVPEQLATLRDRAVIATDLSFTITAPTVDDGPLVWVNPAFCRLTGYHFDEAVGRNCRFLQGPDTDQEVVDRIRAALRAGRGITEVLLNYRKDGTAFWNEIAISPGTRRGRAAGQLRRGESDVTQRVLVEQDRRAALASAEEARGDLRILTEATTWMNAALDMTDVAERLVRSVVPALGDTCSMDLFAEPGVGPTRRVAAAHRDPAKVELLYQVAGLIHGRLPGPDPLQQAMDTGEAVLLPDMPEALVAGSGADDPAAERYRRLSPRSAMLVPLQARGQLLGMAC